VAKYEKPIRLAALLHDIGHCLFSHVGERVVARLPGSSKYPSATTVVAKFSQHFEKDSISIGEILSICILSSKEVIDLLERAGIPGKRPESVRTWIEQAARFVLGLPVKKQPETVFLAQLMNGGLDVDKLDYMAREAHFSGIRLELDLDRILDKIRVFSLESAQLPVELSIHKRFFDAKQKPTVLGLGRGGQFAFEEFCVSRVALYEKIYLHQKIRSAEAQLSSYLKRLPDRYSEYKEVHRWLYLRESDLAHVDSEAPALNPRGPLFSDQKRTLSGLRFEKILDRDLLYRAFAFGPANSLSDPRHDAELSDTIAIKSLPSMMLMEQVGNDLDGFQELIAIEAQRIGELVEHPVPDSLSEDLIIDIPRYSTVQQGHSSVYFERPTRLALRWTMPIDKIVDYYIQNRAVAYVFAPRDLCPIVMLATERVLWTTAKSIFVQEGAVSNEVIQSVDESENNLRSILATKGYYKDAPALAPIPGYLLTAEAQDIIQRICTNLAQFESYKKQRITVSHLMTFLAQFPTDLQDVALKLLQHVEMIDDARFVLAISTAFDEEPLSSAERVALVPLGSMTDSAGRISYSLRDFIATKGPRRIQDVDTLNDSIVLRSQYLVLFDDNVNSGLQVLNIVAGWLGKKVPPELDLHEEHVQPLGDAAKKVLLQLPISLIFAVATDGATERIKSLLSTHLGFDSKRLRVTVHRQLSDGERLFSGKDSPFQTERKNGLRHFLEKVGKELLMSEGKTEGVAKERSLGYSFAEAAIVFPYNVPTMTITALWCGGKWSGGEWIPLVERHRRRSVSGELAGEDA
jgi:hypothetical protein